MYCHASQLKILGELRVDFCNLAELGFNFINELFGTNGTITSVMMNFPYTAC